VPALSRQVSGPVRGVLARAAETRPEAPIMAAPLRRLAKLEILEYNR
jgi:hypothetical protein